MRDSYNHDTARGRGTGPEGRSFTMLIMQIVVRLLPLLLLLPLPLLTSCSSGPTLEKYLPDQSLEYKKQREAEENLEIPPDLASGGFDDALDIPSASGTATYSDYAGGREARQRIATSGDVLPTATGVTLQRSGTQRWLLVDATPQSVWPRIVSFWRQQGILLVEQDPAIGVMKTDWLENRAEIRNDFVTRQLRKVVDGLYATSTRDQYRVRIDAGTKPDTTEVHLSHTAMEERMVHNAIGEETNTVWEPAPSDPDKEAAMLRRMMLYLGVSDRKADQMLTRGSVAPASTGTGAAAAATAGGARLVRAAGGSELVIPAEFREAWRQTGLALDQSGFAVEDRNRSEGVYYVRYQDLERGAGKKKGWGSKLAFWKKDKIDRVQQYQVRLTGGANETRVTVLDADGKRNAGATGDRILSLLEEQLR